MLKYLFTLSLTTCFLFSCKEIISQIYFQKTFGNTNLDWGMDAKFTADSNLIVTGVYNYTGGQGEIYLGKFNTNGSQLWEYTYGTTQHEESNVVQQTSDGYIIAGTIRNAISSQADIILIKTDLSGNLLWTKTYGGTKDDVVSDVILTSDSGFILSGATESYGDISGRDAYLIKTNSTGDTLWTRTMGRTGSVDYSARTEEQNDGTYITSGKSDFGAGAGDFFLCKMTSNGSILWFKTYGGTYYDERAEVLRKDDGGYILAGTSNSFSSLGGIMIIDTDTAGNLLWSKLYLNTTFSILYYNIRLTLDQRYIICGRINNSGPLTPDIFLIKIDTNGSVLWSESYGTTNSGEQGEAVIESPDNGFFVIGQSYQSGSNGDLLLIKTNAIGHSGCNENNFSITSQNIVPLVTTPTISISSGTKTNNLAISINGVNSIITTCLNLGVEETKEEKTFSIFPNVNYGRFTIQTIKDPITNIEIYDFVGNKIYEIKGLNNHQFEISLTSIPNGMYFVNVTTKKNRPCSSKLIVIK